MLAHTLLSAVADGPAPEDVKAGWLALVIFLLLALAVAFLGFSLAKHLRQAQISKDLGAYGDAPSGSAADPGNAPGR